MGQRSRPLVFAALSALVAPCAAAAQGPQAGGRGPFGASATQEAFSPARPKPGSLAAYLDIAARYRSGNRDAASADIRGWTFTQVEAAVADLRGEASRLCLACDATGIDLRTVEAAVLLHAHVTLLALHDLDGASASRHAFLAIGLLEWVHSHVRADVPPCVGRAELYAGLAAAVLAMWDPWLADGLAQRGLREATPDLLFVAACAKEAVAAHAARERRPGEAERALRAAEAAFKRALAVDPGRAEAVLRLGKVLLEQGRLDEAEPLLDRAAADGGDVRRRYLAWLFLGRLRERRHRAAQAAQAFLRALELAPDAQAARFGLAWALEQQAGPAGARLPVLATLAASRRLDRTGDAWWLYEIGPYELAGEILDRLHRRVAAP